jgi:nucleotide-binding universal stress UspA family protein
MLKRIIVTTDGSERAGRAVSFAGSLREQYGGELTCLHVRRPDQPSPETDIRKQAERAGGRVAFLDDDKPAEAICRYAEEIDADAIVIGNYGMSDRKQFLLGNVPNRVSHQAQCTVIIVDTRDAKQRRRQRG